MSLDSPSQVMIIGAQEHLAQEFGKLAAADGSDLILVDSQEEGVSRLSQDYHQRGARSTRLISEPLSLPGIAENIYQAWLLGSLMEQNSRPLSWVINVMAFREWNFPNPDPWDQIGPDPALHLTNLVSLTELFAAEMSLSHGGRILNVLSRPAQVGPSLERMFLATQTLLLDLAYRLNQGLKNQCVEVSTLIASDQSFMLQTEQLPARVAHDLAPPTCSPQDLADYGY
ncbi:MAG: hypothetical protein AAF804_15000, partial [Bacteroidota bacterium]